MFKIMRQLLILPIKFYQIVISPFMANNCRYYPTCSHYSIEAIESFGFFRGSWLAIKRIFSCHPWHEGGYDPVPTHNEKKHNHG